MRRPMNKMERTADELTTMRIARARVEWEKKKGVE
jgi:hypothetical protein